MCFCVRYIIYRFLGFSQFDRGIQKLVMSFSMFILASS